MWKLSTSPGHLDLKDAGFTKDGHTFCHQSSKKHVRPITASTVLFIVAVFFMLSIPTVDGMTYSGTFAEKSVIIREGVHEVTGDLVVPHGYNLTIEPGAVLRVAPMKRITIHGRLLARGTASKRIVFTKMGGPIRPPIGSSPSWPSDIRLVNGSSVLEGALQLKYAGEWRSVCANFRNWTYADAQVTCRQLGLDGAHNFTYNFTAQRGEWHMALGRPSCRGSEANLWSCLGAVEKNMKYSTQVCDNQRNLYLRCDRLLPSRYPGHWRGLEFYNTTHRYVNEVGNRINESDSVVENVDVFWAGLGESGEASAALSAGPYVPHLIGIRLIWNAFDALNFSEVNSTSRLNGCEVAYNRGHGLNVTSYLGRVFIQDSSFHHNHGDGVRMRLVDRLWRVWGQVDMCNAQSNYKFPLLSLAKNPNARPKCHQTYITNRINGKDYRLTVTLLDVSTTRKGTAGMLHLYDGECGVDSECGRGQSPKLATWSLINQPDDPQKAAEMGYTLPQSVVSVQRQITLVLDMGSTCVSTRGCTLNADLLVESALEGPAPEFFVSNSHFSDNMLHGVMVENVRSYLHLEDSSFERNHYGAGLRVRGGAADMRLVNLTIQSNRHSGINITYAGGRRVMDKLKVARNRGPGLYMDFSKEHLTRTARHQITEILQSEFLYNDGAGLKVGNFCGDSVLAINASSHVSFNKGHGIELLSCIEKAQGSTNFTVRDVIFEGNIGQAVRVSPMLNMIGAIRRSIFTGHTRGTLYIDNSNDLEQRNVYKDKPVNFELLDNQMRNNSGLFVVSLRLTESSGIQSLVAQQNIIEQNRVKQAHPGLNPRSHAAAVVVISSSNVVMVRNFINNPDSHKQFATHSVESAMRINATLNWWGRDVRGQAEHQLIRDGIVDQVMRFNLAKVLYYPALINGNGFNGQASNTFPDATVSFSKQVGGKRYIGGRLDGQEFVTARNTEYYVDSDINVLPGYELKLMEGTTLLFDNTVGMLVQGTITVAGTQSSPVSMTTVATTSKLTRDSNETAGYMMRNGVRLMGGSTPYEGLLEVDMGDGEWGTVCRKGFGIEEASMACLTLGLTVHPMGWWIPRPASPYNVTQTIALRGVTCTADDTRLLHCGADRPGQFNDCDHSEDVAVRCVEATWAGVRLTTTATYTSFKHANISRAGLLDFYQLSYTPALQIDHLGAHLDHVTIEHSSLDGLVILFSSPYKDFEIRNGKFTDNVGTGLLSRASSLHIKDCLFKRNREAGFVYDPYMSEEQLFHLRTWITGNNVRDILQMHGQNLELKDGVTYYLKTEGSSDATVRDFVVRLVTPNLNLKVVVQVIDYSPDTDREQLTVYDGEMTVNTTKYVIEDDMVDFPFVSTARVATIKFSKRGVISDRLMLVVRASKDVETVVTSSNVEDPLRKVRVTLKVEDSEFSDNRKGMVIKHYNNPSNRRNDLFYRYHYEHVHLLGLTIRSNQEEGLYVPSTSKYSEVYMPTTEELYARRRMADIRFTVERCLLERNGGAVLAEHNHVPFSNNLWRWEFIYSTITNNDGIGLDLELPLILEPYVNGNHSVGVKHSLFELNVKTGVKVHGGFANLTIVNNTFNQNTAVTGLLIISGTEKDMLIADNTFSNNIAHHVVDVYITSHGEFNIEHYSEFTRNRLYGNRAPDWTGQRPGVNGPSAPPGGSSSRSSASSLGSSYSVGVRGIQKVKVRRNLLEDSAFDFSFVAGVTATLLTSVIDVRENYWGGATTQGQNAIRARILDFEDWNNLAVAEFYPYLIRPSLTSTVTLDPLKEIVFDPSKPLGGRLKHNLQLTKSGSPYEVVADLTVLPGYTLTIDPGVVFRIHPNVGFLILGKLIANGRSSEKIKFLPVESAPTGKRRRKRQMVAAPEVMTAPGDLPDTDDDSSGIGRCTRTEGAGVELCGGDSPGEGFVRIYNSTSRVWAVLCDRQFNDHTGQVLCRHAGYHSQNVRVRHSDLFELYTYGVVSDRYQDVWTRTFLCKGNENDLNECATRTNFNLDQCEKESEYVYVQCGQRNLPSKYEYWGNLRFSYQSFDDRPEPGTDASSRSWLRHVLIYGAGILHNLRVPAVECTYHTPITSDLDIRSSASNAIDFISPVDQVAITNSVLSKNHGHGLGVMVLNGNAQSGAGGNSGVQTSRFIPLVESTIPYSTFGLVRMCGAEKVIPVRERVLVYHKYDFDSVNCVKLFRSVELDKTIGFRLLQFNLYYDNFSSNAIELYNGGDFTPGHRFESMNASTPSATLQGLHQTTTYYNQSLGRVMNQYQMGVHIHATPASGMHGFIAEVVTLESSYTNPGINSRHSIIGNEFEHNEGGALKVSTVGEENPSFVVNGNQVRYNGAKVLNLTASPNLMLYVQNTDAVGFSNNLVTHNNGSLELWTSGLSTALREANISNNIFMHNRNGEALKVHGTNPHTLKVTQNYFALHSVEYLNVVDIEHVSVNLTGNIFSKNRGAHLIDLWGQAKQDLTRNFFYNNTPGEKYAEYNENRINVSLVFAEGKNKQINGNWLVNDRFYFQLATHNRSIYETNPQASLNSSHNFWGEEINPQSAIYDYVNDFNLTAVNFNPYMKTNASLLEGLCLPGWKEVAKRCYRYYGGVAPRAVAEEICALERGYLAKATAEYWASLGFVVRISQRDYSKQIRAWVNFPTSTGKMCAVVVDDRFAEVPCTQRNPFICQKDEGVILLDETFRWWQIVVGVVSAIVVLAVTAFIVLILWCKKSASRKKQNFERKASMRSSLRSSRYALSAHTLNASLAGSRPLSRFTADTQYDIDGATQAETDTDTVVTTKSKAMNGYAHSDDSSTNIASSVAGAAAAKQSVLSPGAEYRNGAYHPDSHDTLQSFASSAPPTKHPYYAAGITGNNELRASQRDRKREKGENRDSTRSSKRRDREPSGFGPPQYPVDPRPPQYTTDAEDDQTTFVDTNIDLDEKRGRRRRQDHGDRLARGASGGRLNDLQHHGDEGLTRKASSETFDSLATGETSTGQCPPAYAQHDRDINKPGKAGGNNLDPYSYNKFNHVETASEATAESSDDDSIYKPPLETDIDSRVSRQQRQQGHPQVPPHHQPAASQRLPAASHAASPYRPAGLDPRARSVYGNMYVNQEGGQIASDSAPPSGFHGSADFLDHSGHTSPATVGRVDQSDLYAPTQGGRGGARPPPPPLPPGGPNRRFDRNPALQRPGAAAAQTPPWVQTTRHTDNSAGNSRQQTGPNVRDRGRPPYESPSIPSGAGPEPYNSSAGPRNDVQPALYQSRPRAKSEAYLNQPDTMDREGSGSPTGRDRHQPKAASPLNRLYANPALETDIDRQSDTDRIPPSYYNTSKSTGALLLESDFL